MKIDFTQQAYRTLVELLHLADWMLHANDAEERPETAEYRDLIQMIVSHYKEMRCEDLLEWCHGAVLPTSALENRMWPAIEAYDNTTFWQQIAARLAERDAEASVGHTEFQEMDDMKRLDLISAHEERWQDEFEKHGLMRLVARDTPSDAPYEAHTN